MKRMTKNEKIKMCNDFIKKCPNHGIFTKYFRTHMLTELPNGAPLELKFVRAIDIYFSEQGKTKKYISKELLKLGYKDCSKKADELIEEYISSNTEFVDDEIAVDVSYCSNERDLIEEICNLVADVEYIIFKFKERYPNNAKMNDEDENEDIDWDSFFKDDDGDGDNDDVDNDEDEEDDDDEEEEDEDEDDDEKIADKSKTASRTADDSISTERLQLYKEFTDVVVQKIDQSEKEETKLCDVIVEKFEMSPRLTAFAIGKYTQAPREQIEAKLEKLPLTIAENISIGKANELVFNLSKVKVTAKIEYK